MVPEQTNRWLLYIMYCSFMHNYTDVTDDESVEMEFTIENWSMSDLGIIMLMFAVGVGILFNFFSNIGWIQFVEGNIIIVPVILGLILQYDLHFKRSALKLVTATSHIVKRMTLNNVLTTNSVVQRTAMTILSFTVKTIYSSIVAAIMFVVKKPLIVLFISILLISIDSLIVSNSCCTCAHGSRTIEAACLSLMILTALFDHVKFARRSINLSAVPVNVLIYYGVGFCVAAIWFKMIMDYLIMIIVGGGFLHAGILIFCFNPLHFLCSHEMVYIAVAPSITIFNHDLVLSLVEIPDILSITLHFILMLVLFLYSGAYYYLVVFNLSSDS